MDRINARPRASHGNRSPNELFMGQREDLLAAQIDCTNYLKLRKITGLHHP